MKYFAYAIATCAVLTSAPALAQDAASGEKVFRKCQACHVADEETNKVGPHLFKVIGRTPGSLEDFKYSNAMKEYGEGKVWDDETLGAYLAAPRKEVKGTRMAFAGLRKDEEIADVIAYLSQYSDQGDAPAE